MECTLTFKIDFSSILNSGLSFFLVKKLKSMSVEKPGEIPLEHTKLPVILFFSVKVPVEKLGYVERRAPDFRLSKKKGQPLFFFVRPF